MSSPAKEIWRVYWYDFQKTSDHRRRHIKFLRPRKVSVTDEQLSLLDTKEKYVGSHDDLLKFTASITEDDDLVNMVRQIQARRELEPLTPAQAATVSDPNMPTTLPAIRDSCTPIHACTTATPACTHCSAAVSTFAQSADSVCTAATPAPSTISITSPTAAVSRITIPDAVAAPSSTVTHFTIPAATCAPCLSSVPALSMTVPINPHTTAFPLGSPPATITQPCIGDSAVLKDIC